MNFETFFELARLSRSLADFARARAALLLGTDRGDAADHGISLLEFLVILAKDAGDHGEAFSLFEKLCEIELGANRQRKSQLELLSAFLMIEPENPRRDLGLAYSITRNCAEHLAPERRDAAVWTLLYCAAEEENLVPEPELRKLVQRFELIEQATQEDRARADWLLGLANRQLGRVIEAEDLLKSAIASFESLPMPLYWGVASLDLAALKVNGGKVEEAAKICAGLFPLLRWLRQYEMPLFYLQNLIQQCAKGAVNTELLRRVRTQFQIATSRPDQRPA